MAETTTAPNPTVVTAARAIEDGAERDALVAEYFPGLDMAGASITHNHTEWARGANTSVAASWIDGDVLTVIRRVFAVIVPASGKLTETSYHVSRQGGQYWRTDTLAEAVRLLDVPALDA